MGINQIRHGAPALRWGIKRSFISYLSRLPDGSVSAEAGASIVSGSYFQFEPEGGGPAVGAAAPAEVRKFRGQVRLSGHHGMMSLYVADPWLEFGGAGAVLSVADPQQPAGSGGRLELLRLAVPVWPEVGWPDPAGTDWRELPARLSPAAVEFFNGQYEAGEEMDPVFLGAAVPGE